MVPSVPPQLVGLVWVVPVTTGAGLIITVTVLLVACEGFVHSSLDSSTQLITSLLSNIPVNVGSFVPASTPFFFH